MNRLSSRILGLCLLVGLLLAFQTSVSATPVLDIINPSFETPILGDNLAVSCSGTQYGWTWSGSGGIWRPASSWFTTPPHVPEGVNVAWFHGGQISQTLQHTTLQENFTYNLQVYTAKISTSTLHYTVELVAAEHNFVLASTTGLPAYKQFNQVGVTFQATNAYNTYFGDHLKIVLIDPDAREVDFDNVTLDATSTVPIPAGLMLFGSGLLGMALMRRRVR